MSRTLLHQLRVELRRLVKAGFFTASADPRLAAILPPLDRLAPYSSVLKRLAGLVRGLIHGPTESAPSTLLELLELLQTVCPTLAETDLPGPLETPDRLEIDLPDPQTPAQTLLRIRAALTQPGRGRLEILREAQAQGWLRDLRLLPDLIAAIDDGQTELAEFVAEQVLPEFGSPIIPMIKEHRDIRGGAADARKLRLLHRLDPESTRSVVLSSLKSGSREVRLAAVDCLGSQPGDASYLIALTREKSREVRKAAYRQLIRHGGSWAADRLADAVSSADFPLVLPALYAGQSELATAIVTGEIRRLLAEWPEIQPGTEETQDRLDRLQQLASTLDGRTDPASSACVAELFRKVLKVVKSSETNPSRIGLLDTIIPLLLAGPEPLPVQLAEAHGQLPPAYLKDSFRAASRSLGAARTLEIFSPYLRSKPSGRSRSRLADERRQALIQALLSHAQAGGDFDPRWLDLALEVGDAELVSALASRLPENLGQALQRAIAAARDNSGQA